MAGVGEKSSKNYVFIIAHDAVIVKRVSRLLGNPLKTGAELFLGEGEFGKWLAFDDPHDIVVGGFDGFEIRLHDIEQLLTHGVSIIARIATIEAILADLPGRHALKLHFYKATDLILADIGGEAAGEVVEDFGVFGEDDGGATDFFDDGADYVLLVLNAVTITSGVSITFTSKGKGKFAIHVHRAFWDSYSATMERCDLLIRIDFNAADGIHQAFDGRKIDFEVIINFDIKQVLERIHGHLHAIDTSMGKFVAVASSAMELYIIIAWDRSEQNFVGGGVDGSKHVDITAATLHIGHVAIGINTADKDSERLGRDVDIATKNFFGVNTDFDSVKDAGGFAETIFAIFRKIVKCFLVDSTNQNGVSFVVAKASGERTD